MKSACVLIVGIVSMAGGTLRAEDFSTYRGFQLGQSLQSVAKQADMKPTDATIVHARPALIQQLDWWPHSRIQGDVAKVDPVENGLLCFYNGELFRIIVTYDSYRVQGMTAEDMIDVLSATYGKSSKPEVDIAYHSLYGEVAPVLARWEDSQYAYNLIRTGDQSSFVMILYSKRLDALAQAAISEAVRLETAEAPQREIEKQKMRAEEDRVAREKARTINKPNFRP
jgi:hypothetical protein